MVMMSQPDGEGLSEADVDARSRELIAEFEGHFRDVVELHPEVESRREHVFQAWAMQKIAGLQLAVEEIARKFNVHVGSPEE